MIWGDGARGTKSSSQRVGEVGYERSAPSSVSSVAGVELVGASCRIVKVVWA